jgi:hypothetical protein
MAKRQFSLQIIQDYAAEKGGKVLTKDYQNSTSFCIWQCQWGHKWKETPLKVLGKKSESGSWCPKCLVEGKS